MPHLQHVPCGRGMSAVVIDYFIHLVLCGHPKCISSCHKNQREDVLLSSHSMPIRIPQLYDPRASNLVYAHHPQALLDA